MCCLRGSIGRTDLPGAATGGIESIKGRLLTLPDDTDSVFPGHGPSTTIKQEQQSNPYIL